MHNIILVHGAAHTGACWSRVEELLGRRGLRTAAPTLSGHGENKRAALRVSMRRYGEDVVAAAERLPGKSILVGHSMGGFVITEAAEQRPDLFSKLVYLTAMVPKPGRSSMMDMPPAPAEVQKAGRLSLNGTLAFRLEPARQLIYHRCPEDVLARVPELLCPQPLRPSLSKVDATDRSGRIPKYYIECSDDRVIPLASQRAMQAPWTFKRTAAIDADHMPLFSAPEQVAALIAEMADD